MYGVLYAITPELFLTKDRGTGNAITAMANRIFGIMVRFLSILTSTVNPAGTYSGAYHRVVR